MAEVYNMEALLQIVALEAQTHAAAATKLNGSLNEGFRSFKRLGEEIYTLKHDLAETSNLYF